jgi:hypothetical protein
VEASNVAKIQPTSGDVRRRYRETLPGPRQRRAFDELGRLVDSPRDDAVRERWPDQQLRFTVQERSHSKPGAVPRATRGQGRVKARVAAR